MNTLPPAPPGAPTTRPLREPAWADVADLSPAYFAMVMATGIVSLAAHRAQGFQIEASSQRQTQAALEGEDGFLRRRIKHGDDLARLTRTPFAVDEQLSVGICHETCSLLLWTPEGKCSG